MRQNANDLGIKTNITLFERSSYVGGRSTTVYAWDDPNLPIELGASIFVKVNKILVSAVENFNLSIDSARSVGPENVPELGIYNGYELVLQTAAGSGWWDTAKLLWRYGLAPIRTNNLMKSTTGKFFKMYDEPHFPFKSLTKVAYNLGLTAVTAATGEQYLKENSIGALFANEVVQARYASFCCLPNCSLMSIAHASITLRISPLSMDWRRWSVWRLRVPCPWQGVIGRSSTVWLAGPKQTCASTPS